MLIKRDSMRVFLSLGIPALIGITACSIGLARREFWRDAIRDFRTISICRVQENVRFELVFGYLGRTLLCLAILGFSLYLIHLTTQSVLGYREFRDPNRWQDYRDPPNVWRYRIRPLNESEVFMEHFSGSVAIVGGGAFAIGVTSRFTFVYLLTVISLISGRQNCLVVRAVLGPG